MESEYNYTCPNCSQQCTVSETAAGQNVTCPSCTQDFFATPPEPQPPAIPQAWESGFVMPTKLPFFKSGRKKLLEDRLGQLLMSGDGAITKEAEDELNKNAIALGLGPDGGSELLGERFMQEFAPIQKRAEATFLMTDDDVSAIEQLKRKYHVKLDLGGDAGLFRAIFLLESTRELPAPIQTDLLLDGEESVFYVIRSTWHQTRVHAHGYAGSSISIPTGISGVRFRFGGYTPIKSEEITALSNGILYVTSKRLLFNGEERNTSVTLKRLVDGHIFSDALRIEKSTGKPDYFTMRPTEARYVLALICALK